MAVHDRSHSKGKAAAGRARGSSARQAATAGTSVVVNPTEAALSSDDVLDLQRDAGNQAVTKAIQRDAVVQRQPDDARVYPGDGDPLPTSGPEVRAALQGRFPGLLRALTPAQLDQWQKVVDHYTIAWEVDRQRQKLWEGYAYFGVTREAVPEYQRKRRRLDRAVPPRPSEELAVDVRLLFADDVQEPPEWDVDAETAFRQWAVERITKAPLRLSLRPTPGEALNQHPMPGIVHKTKGFVTARDLINEYHDEYETRVVNREAMVKLRQALHETNEVWYEATTEHRARSDKNAERIGWGIVRHISEALGEGDADYPTIRIWDRPRQLIDAAYPLLQARKFELAAPIIAMAEQATAECAQRFFAYENRVMTGAGTAVKWLGRLKTAGSIAAGIASGGLGLTGSALVAGGYTLVQEGAGRAAEMHYGQRTHFGVASLIEAAGTSALMTVLGGALQARFQAAIKARIDQLPNLAGTKLADMTASALAAGTSSVYTTAAELAIKAVIDKQALPADAQALADLVIDKAVENVAMDVGLAGVNSRVAREYQTWREGKGRPAVTVPEPSTTRTRPGDRAVPTPGDQGPGTPETGTAEVSPRQLSEVAARRLLTQAGGWERLHAELQTGTGLGANMPVAERRALIDRFEAHRVRLARDAAAVFDGSVSIVDSGAGQRIRVTFEGADATQRIAQATEYLDTKRPGWREDTRVEVEAAPATSTRTTPVTTQLAAHLQPQVRVLADGFVPLHADWAGLTPMQRLQRMGEVVNGQLQAQGVPTIGVRFEPGRTWAHMRDTTWEISMPREAFMEDHPSPAEFASLCALMAHEARHAHQWFQAMRTITDPAELRSRSVPDHVIEAVEKSPRMDPASMEHQEAREWYESVWGTGAKDRKETLTDLKKAVKGLARAEASVTAAQDRLLAARRPEDIAAAQEDLDLSILARDSYRSDLDSVDPRYRALAEEIDAYDWQGHVEQAVNQRFQQEYRNAVDAERAAYEHLRRLQARGDAVIGPPTALTIESHREIARAVDRMLKAIARLERLEGRVPRPRATRLPT